MGNRLMLLPCRAILTLYKIIKRECIAMSKRLVTYFFASGVSAKVAENLADAIGADIFEIQLKVSYTKADLNWMDKKVRSTIEMSDPASRPAIAAKRDNIAEYDTIFVGYSSVKYGLKKKNFFFRFHYILNSHNRELHKLLCSNNPKVMTT